MRFASRRPPALLLALVPSLFLGAVAALDCSSDAKAPVATGDLPGVDAAVVTVQAGDGATGPRIVRAEVARAHADDSAPATITVRLDKPFLVAVVDASGAILFLGQVNDPSSGG